MKIAITTSSFAQYSDEPLRLLQARDIEYVCNSTGRALTEAEAIALFDGCAGVVAGTEPLTRRVFEACLYLKAVSRCGTGMDSVDMPAAQELGILVRNTPDGPTLAVAELTVGYALDLLRHISRMDREVRAGVWKKRMGHLLHEKNIGVVGFGRIGRAVARLFRAFGAEVAFADPMTDDAHYTRMDVDALLSWSHIITLHCPKQPDGAFVLDTTRLHRMRKGAWLINAARGGLVDEDALYDVLEQGHLAGAALDVFGKEPYTGPLARLAQLDTVILTPHIGSYARESRIQMEVDAVKNLLDALEQVCR